MGLFSPPKSALPPEMDQKYLAVVRASQQPTWLTVVSPLAVLAVFGGLPFLLHLSDGLVRTGALLSIALAMATVVWLGLRNNRLIDRQCREIGLMCPHCGNPLFLARARRDFLRQFGCCPACHLSVVPTR